MKVAVNGLQRLRNRFRRPILPPEMHKASPGPNRATAVGPFQRRGFHPFVAAHHATAPPILGEFVTQLCRSTRCASRLLSPSVPPGRALGDIRDRSLQGYLALVAGGRRPTILGEFVTQLCVPPGRALGDIRDRSLQGYLALVARQAADAGRE